MSGFKDEVNQIVKDNYPEASARVLVDWHNGRRICLIEVSLEFDKETEKVDDLKAKLKARFGEQQIFYIQDYNVGG